MNLLELRTAVERRSGVQYDPDGITEVLNEALFAISAERDWPWLEDTWRFSTTADRGDYSPPFSVRRVATVAVGNWLIPMVNQTMLDSSTYEVGWTLRGGVLTLSPTPGSPQDVVVQVVRNETALTNDLDRTLMPDEWQQGALVNFAASILLERIDELPRADRCLDRYNQAKRRMISQASAVRGPHRIRTRPGSMI